MVETYTTENANRKRGHIYNTNLHISVLKCFRKRFCERIGTRAVSSVIRINKLDLKCPLNSLWKYVYLFKYFPCFSCCLTFFSNQAAISQYLYTYMSTKLALPENALNLDCTILHSKGLSLAAEYLYRAPTIPFPNALPKRTQFRRRFVVFHVWQIKPCLLNSFVPLIRLATKRLINFPSANAGARIFQLHV